MATLIGVKHDQSDAVSLLIFTARWSPGSMLLAQELQRIAPAGMSVQVVDVDEEFAAAEQWRVICVPTVVVRTGDRERRRIVGVACVDAVAVAGKLRHK